MAAMFFCEKSRKCDPGKYCGFEATFAFLKKHEQCFCFFEKAQAMPQPL